MPLIRLDKIISDTGHYTRSEATALIKSGCVTVGGFRAGSGALKADPENAIIMVNGKRLDYIRYRYLMLNKPAGYVSSTSDRRERTVMELLPQEYAKLGLFPAGRLDKDAEGLLILTNDGETAHRITSPLKNIGKLYFVEIDGSVQKADIDAFAHGVVLGDGTRCLPALLENAAGGALVTVYEGKFHQVKRMMSAIGKPVKRLKRLAIGGLKLDEGLASGQYRELGSEIETVFFGK